MPRSWASLGNCSARVLGVTAPLLRAVAGAIAVTLQDEPRPVRAAGRDLFIRSFVRPGETLGKSRCRAVYAAVLRDLQLARRRRWRRRIYRLRSSYDHLEQLGIPKEVCDRARRSGESMSARVEAVNQPRAPLEEDLSSLRPEEVLLDPLSNTWWMQRADGEWTGALPHAGLVNRLNQLGFHPKTAKAFLAGTRSFHERKVVFGVEDDLVQRGAEVIFNTFRPSAVEPEAGAWPDIYSVILSVSNGDAGFANYLLDWLALPLQTLKRRRKPQLNRTAVVLHGLEGSGKNTLNDIMKAIYGPGNCVTLSQKDIDGRFVAQLRWKLFAFCNEVMSSTNKSPETANTLKAWIADDVISLEAKNVDAENVENTANFVFASNDDAPVIISPTDRRYSVKRATRRLPDDVAEHVKADLQGPQRQVAAFLGFLLRRKVSMRVGEVYETEDRKAIQHATLSSEVRFCREVAEDGWLAVATPWADEAPPHITRGLHDSGFISSNTLAEVYAWYCKRHGLKSCGPTKLAQALKAAVRSARAASPRLGKAKTKTRGYWGIPLDVAGQSSGEGTAQGCDVVPMRGREQGPATPPEREAQP